MRGKAGKHIDEIRAVRITPAYAGKRSARWIIRPISPDHPRLCGEKFPLCVYRILPAGSPPPMRGKDLSLARHLRRFGITPAYAGKSVTDAEEVTASEDHPRLCGEKMLLPPLWRLQIGSPPPMRGKDFHTKCF